MKVIYNGGEELSQYNPDNLSQTQLWLLQLSGVHTELNNRRHDTLYGEEKSKQSIELHKKTLERDWDIIERKDFFYEIDGLINCNDTVRFNYELNCISLLPYSLQEKRINAISEDNPLYRTYKLAKASKYKLPKSGILAWDISRHVQVCRIASLAGLITDDEAWELIAKAGPIAQEAYSSWYEYGLAYILGRLRNLYVSPSITEERIKNHAKYLYRFIQNAKVPWDIKLEL